MSSPSILDDSIGARAERIASDAVASLRSRRFSQLIDGELVAGATSQGVIDPATELTIATVPVADNAQIDQAVDAAKRAFATWRKTDLSERIAIVQSIIERIEQHRDDIAQLTTLEMGKPYEAALGDVDLALTWARDTAADVTRILTPLIAREDETVRVEVRRKPIGVVAAIVPWNFPFFQSVYKLVPAVLTGNTVVLKPAPTSPLNGLLLGEIIADIVPAGVVNVIGDGGDAGPVLVAHPGVGKVSFTGSTAAGRRVLGDSAATLRHVVLELGGNDAALVLDDADIAEVARGIFHWAFLNTGQVCINIKRIFVPRARYDEFCEVFAGIANNAKIGHGLDPLTEFGPLAHSRQYEAAKSYVEVAHRDGAVIAGGSIPEGPGYFVPPTVVRDVDPNSTLIREETFGPVRSIIAYDDVDEAIELINDTIYGLGNSVWSSDIDRAVEVADQLESGSVWINEHFALYPDVPFGGQKQSGVGTEFGDEGVLLFTEIQALSIPKH